MMTMTVVAMGGLGVLAVAWVAAMSFRRASASLRHSIWLAALFSALILPAFEWADVEVEIPLPAEFAVALPGWIDVALLHSSVAASSNAVGSVEATTTPAPSGSGVGRSAARVARAGASSGHAAGTGVGVGHDSQAESGTVGAMGRTQATAGVATSDRLATAGVGGSAGGADPAPSTARAPNVGALVFATWLVGGLVLLTLTILSHIRARFIASDNVRAPTADAWARLGNARLEMGVERTVDMVVSGQVTVPATWGFAHPVIVLPEEYGQWSRETLDRVLLHELAHIARRDCEAYLVGDVARAIHWFNPLAWLAARRLRVESERACDDRVLEVIGRPSAYAADLVAIVRALGGRGGVPRAALAMAQPGSVSDRVRAILDPTRSRGRVRPQAAAIIGVVALCLVLSATIVTPSATAALSEADTGKETTSAPFGTATAAAPETGPATANATGTAATTVASASRAPRTGSTVASAQERLCVFREGGRRSTSIDSDDKETRIRWETDDCRVEIDMLGDVEFSSDDRRVVGLGPDARFEIEERIGRDERRARIEGQPGGGLERRYWQDGDEVAWGPEADRWLASLLPEIFRHTTINAEARVRRMVAEGGPDRVFAELRQIESDHVTRTYLEVLMDVAELTEADYRRVIEAATNIDSDHGSAELLMAVVARAGLQPSFQDPLLAASERLESDHQRSRILQMLLDSPLSDAQLDAVLASARSIDSDHNLGELLSSIAAAGRMDDGARASFLETLRSIDSDHMQATVIHAFLDAGRLSDAELAQLLDLSEYLDSDHQRADILQRVARDYPLTGRQVSIYLRSAARMSSDHQKATTAKVIIERADFSGEQMRLVLQMADDVDSSHQQVEILGSVIRRRPLDAGEMSDLLAIAATIDSSHQLRTVISLIVEEQRLETAGLVELLGVVGRIDSGHQRVDALLEVAERYELRGEALEAYSGVAQGLNGRDRERAMAAISG